MSAAATRQLERGRRVLEALAAVQRDAKARGLKKGNGGVGEIPCPNNCGGTVYYALAAKMGDTMGRCTTKGCATWME